MAKTQYPKVLVLAPHTDDGELGCGGTIVKLIEQGSEVYYVAFSACEQSVLPQFPKDILITEVKAATKVLGIKPENLNLLKYDVRTFNYHRQAILDDIIRFKQEINPDLVLVPAPHDIHQDHATISNEAIRAFKFTSVLCYELPWNNFTFATTCFFHLEERHIEKKIRAFQEYKSQAHRTYANEEFLRALARTRGVQINTRYAEVFEVIRLINN
jgi:LmbE family N-acetylglucosaminyl deacetylase